MDEQFNQPSERRKALLVRLQSHLGDVPAHFWAACHLCETQSLELLVDMAERNKDVVWLAATNTYSMVVNWNQLSVVTTPGASPIGHRTRSSASLSSTLNRSQSARDQAKMRDRHRCVLTGSGAFQVCHIYPFSLLHNDGNKLGKRSEFWRRLKMFWPLEKIEAWEAVIFPHGPNQDGIETVENLISLSADAHVMWNQGAFALKPISISEDQKTLIVEFFWQIKQPSITSESDLLDLTTIPLSTRNLDGNNNTFLHSGRRDLIASGKLVEMKTDDPARRPLPSMALLEMQWFLQRTMGMAGATEIDAYLEDCYFSDDGRFSTPDLKEAGEDSFMSSITSLSDPLVPELNAMALQTPKRQDDEMEIEGSLPTLF